MVMPFSEDSQSCLNKVRPRTITRSGFRTSSMARNASRPSVISSGVAEGGGCGALPFPCAGRTHRKPRYPIPRWARVEVFPVSMTEMLRTVRIQWLPLPPAASRNARRTRPVSVCPVGSIRSRVVVGFTEHEDARVGVGVAVPHVGEEMDGLVLLQMDAA